ncbi:MAG: hypothetical protein ACPGUI_00495 [Halarcobacter sp.]
MKNTSANRKIKNGVQVVLNSKGKNVSSHMKGFTDAVFVITDSNEHPSPMVDKIYYDAITFIDGKKRVTVLDELDVKLFHNKDSKHYGMTRGYFVPSKSSQEVTPNLMDEINIGYYHEGGGNTGEFSVRWYTLDKKLVPRLEIYDDAWSVLDCFTDLFICMKQVSEESITPDEFIKLLNELEIKQLSCIK